MLFSHISVMRVTPVMRTPWFFSVIRLRVAGKNISINSGTRLMIRKAQSAAFFRIYAFGDFINLSTSDARSLAISGDAIAPRVHNAKPMTNCVELFKSLCKQNQGGKLHRKFVLLFENIKIVFKNAFLSIKVRALLSLKFIYIYALYLYIYAYSM